jgi:sucrose-6-phosphate hydrolase SacC (GH32 family)
MKYLKALLFASVLPVAVLAQVDTSSQHFYLFTYFKNLEQDKGARLAVSSDGINWQIYNNEQPVFTPTLTNEHLCRDPYTYFDSTTGVFHIVWTDGWETKSIGYATSKDLKTWTTQTELPLGTKIPNCACMWAPEIFFDDIKDSFMVYWSTDVGVNGKRSYYSLTKDFKNFSAPIKFFDPGYTVIDDDILKADEGKYYIFFKDERDPAQAGTQAKNIHYVYGTKPEGPWSAVSKWISTPGCEGPSAIKIGNEVRVYFDPYTNPPSSYRMVKVTNLDTTASPWPQGDILKTAAGNFLYNHGHIIEIPKVKVLQLLYGIADPKSYSPWTVYPGDSMHVADPPRTPLQDIPEGKRNTGCGTGVGLAFLPPIFFKIAASRNRKRRKG